MATMPAHALHRPVIDWYRNHARALPWREPSAGPWAVLVSEVMLQQTPVARVLPAYEKWMARWPTLPPRNTGARCSCLTILST